MAVYVDNARNKYGRMRMCHMWADTFVELLHMADRIGVPRKHVQGPPDAKWVHFDICQSKRKLAVEHGAKETDRYGALEHVAKNTGNRKLLAMVKRIRARKSDERQE